MKKISQGADAQRKSTGKAYSGHVFSGMLWLVLQTLGSRAVGVVSQLLLAWILDPTIFGIISTVYAVTTLAGVVTNFGIDDLLLQRRRSLAFWAPTALIFQFILSVLALLVSVLGGCVASIYLNNGEVVLLSLLVGFNFLFGPMQILPSTILRLRMDFKIISIVNFSENALQQVSVISLAYLGWGAYSFVAFIPIISLAKSAVLWYLCRSKFSWGAEKTRSGKIRLRKIAILLRNGSMIFQTRFFVNVVSQGDYVVLGFFSNTAEVGYYFFAYKLAVQPLWLIAGNISSVIYPALVALSKEHLRQMAAAKRAAMFLSYSAFPVCFLQGELCRPALSVVFGAKWEASIPILQILSFGIGFDAVGWVAGTYLNARREYAKMLRTMAVFAGIFLIMVTIGAYTNGVLGVAVSVSFYHFLIGVFFANMIFGSRLFDVVAFWELLLKPAILAFAALTVCFVSTYLIDYWWQLISSPILFLTTYLLLLRLSAKDVAEEFIARIWTERLGRSISVALGLIRARLG